MWKNLLNATDLHQTFRDFSDKQNINLENEHARYYWRKEITKILQPWFLARKLKEIEKKLTQHEVCWEKFQTFKQMITEDPRFSENNAMFSNLNQPGVGSYLAPGSPLDFSAQERLPVHPAPILGQHTNEILNDVLGLPDHTIAKLHDDCIVADPTPPE